MRGERRRLLGLILSTIGVGSVAPLIACGASVTVEGGGGAGGSGAAQAASGSGTATTSTGSSSGGAAPTSVSVGPGTAAGGSTPECPYDPVSTMAPPPPGLMCPPPTPNMEVVYVCLPGAGSVEGCEQLHSRRCVLDSHQCGLFWEGVNVSCGPLLDGGNCCYVIEGYCAVGRPFTIDGAARLAALAQRSDWLAELTPDARGLDERTRRALAEVWAAEGQSEHASVASFSRFVLQLLSLGAPPDLVRDAQRAIADELEHARVAFALASHYGGVPLGPAPLSMVGALGETDPVAIADSVCREGAIAETVAALIVAAARDEARDEAVHAALTKIADEEMAHALLAWRYLAWTLREHGEPVRRAVVRAFAEAEQHVGCGPVSGHAGDAELMRAHGYLSLEERRRVARSALADVVSQAAAALLSPAAFSAASRSHAP